MGLVTITSEVEFGAGEAAGSGIVIGSDGLVVTNHHVVEGATSIQVTVVTTGRTYDAEVLGTNAKRDVAVLQLEDASGLATASADASGVAVGDDVTAVGDAGGDGGALTAAAGTVTDTDHPITVSDEQTGAAHRLTQLIEVDADIIPGDSGGALLESDGDVVGMNVAASSGSADITGYVIPIKRVLRIAARVVAGEETASITLGYDAFLGVSLAGTGTHWPASSTGERPRTPGSVPATPSPRSAAPPSRRTSSSRRPSPPTTPATPSASPGPTLPVPPTPPPSPSAAPRRLSGKSPRTAVTTSTPTVS